MIKETLIWHHYTDYLKEALRQTPNGSKKLRTLKTSVDTLHEKVKSGCSKEILLEGMLRLFVPATIMQSLEMWQNYMDLFNRTGIRAYGGKTREEMEGKMFTDMVDGVEDDPLPDTPLYDLGSTSQLMIYFATKDLMRESPMLLEKIRKDGGLAANWELMMLLGDMYAQTHQKDKARKVYLELWEANGHKDDSILASIRFLDLFP